jgi:hypothetical protein
VCNVTADGHVYHARRANNNRRGWDMSEGIQGDAPTQLASVDDEMDPIRSFVAAMPSKKFEEKKTISFFCKD